MPVSTIPTMSRERMASSIVLPRPGVLDISGDSMVLEGYLDIVKNPKPENHDLYVYSIGEVV